MTDVDALNQEFQKYDQVRKAHTYRLAEGERDEFDDDYRIATLDFGQFLRGNAEDKARFAEAFTGALEEIGFTVLTGHGVDPALYDEMQDALRGMTHGDVREDWAREHHPKWVEAERRP